MSINRKVSLQYVLRMIQILGTQYTVNESKSLPTIRLLDDQDTVVIAENTVRHATRLQVHGED